MLALVVGIFLAVVVLIGVVGLVLIVVGQGHHRELERYRSKQQRRREAPATLEGGDSHLR